jgi:hypothetical protein
MRCRAFNLFLPWLLLSASATALADDGCRQYGNADTTLTGRLASREYYGPPGYGENPATDRRERQVVLMLDKPLCVERSADGYDEAERGQVSVTMVPTGVEIQLGTYLNRHVRVQGKLFHAFTRHHHTPLLLELEREPTLIPEF